MIRKKWFLWTALAAVLASNSLPALAENSDVFLEEWPAVYKEIVEAYGSEYQNEYGECLAHFKLYDMDNNSIPELIVQMPHGGFDFYTFHDGEAECFFYIDAGDFIVEEDGYEYDTETVSWNYQAVSKRLYIRIGKNYAVDDDSPMIMEQWWDLSDGLLNAEILNTMYAYGETYKDEDGEIITDEEWYLWRESYYGPDVFQLYDFTSDGDDLQETFNALNAHGNDAYFRGYESEMSGIDSVVSRYYSLQEEDSTYKPLISWEEAVEFADSLEEGYEKVDEAIPELKNILAEQAGLSYGDSAYSSYVISENVSRALGDSEGAKFLRKGAAIGAAGIINIVAALPYDTQPEAASTCLSPIAIGKNYALVATYGNIDQILYSYKSRAEHLIEPLESRLEDIKSIRPYQAEDDPEAYAEYQGRRDAIIYAMWMSNEAYQKLEDDYTRLFWSEDTHLNEAEREAFRNARVAFVIDKEGTFQSSFLMTGNFDAVVDDEGNCALRCNNEGWTILDKGGNVIAQSGYVYDSLEDVLSTEQMNQLKQDMSWGATVETALDNLVNYSDIVLEKVNYRALSPYGTIIKETRKSDFDHGDYIQVELIDIAGNVLYSDDVAEFSCSDYDEKCYEVKWKPLGSNDREEALMEMATGQLLNKKEYDKQKKLDAEAIIYPEGVRPDKTQDLNNGYYLCFVDNKVYDFDGNEMGDLSAGQGVEKICFANDHYFIVSNSGYYYVTDANFQRIFEPMKLPESRTYELSSYGLFIDRDDDMDFYDENGELVFTFEGMHCYDRTSLFQGHSDWGLFDFICGCSRCGWYNLNTKELMEFDFLPENVKVVKIGDSAV